MHISIKREGSIWTCQECGAQGTMKELMASTCAKYEKCLSPEEQLSKWVGGESICPNSSGECCPDFSCCTPEVKTPKEAREAFQRATPQQRESMLMSFLGGILPKGAHLAGKEEPN